MRQLTAHFSLKELTDSTKAVEQGIDNTPPDDIVAHLQVAAEGMEQVRALLGFPIKVNSGYRCPELNKAVHGAVDSAHMNGYAVDFICPQYGDPTAIVRTIVASGVKYDKVIMEQSWVHISFDPKLRGVNLIAKFDANGDATYTHGVA